jgi:hypothetical protein
MIGEGDDPVKVIWHRKDQAPTPFATAFPELDGLNQFSPDFRLGQLVVASWVTIDGNEERFMSGIDP